jgi:hypothetical protein
MIINDSESFLLSFLISVLPEIEDESVSDVLDLHMHVESLKITHKA